MYPIKPVKKIRDYLVVIWYGAWAGILLYAYVTYDYCHSMMVYASSEQDMLPVGYIHYCMHSAVALLLYGVGSAAYLMVPFFMWCAYQCFYYGSYRTAWARIIGWSLLFIGYTLLAALYQLDSQYAPVPGGIFGRYGVHVLLGIFITDTLYLLLSGLVFVACLLLLGKRGLAFLADRVYPVSYCIVQVIYMIGLYGGRGLVDLKTKGEIMCRRFYQNLIDSTTFLHAGYMVPCSDKEYDELLLLLNKHTGDKKDIPTSNDDTMSMRCATVTTTFEKKSTEGVGTVADVETNVPTYTVPPASLFISRDHQASVPALIEKEMYGKVALLEEKLSCFGVKGTVVNVTVGPVVALFEYKPDIETKISKIVALEDDLALALQAHSIRTIAPIPGKAVVGFEIAHDSRQPVHLADIIHSPYFQQNSAHLPIVLGHDCIGQQVVADLARMPHLLVAGSTGSGKSVGLNTMLVSLLCAKSPDQMRLVLIDPKRLEFGVYADIPHLLFPIVNSSAQVVPVLRWVVAHMEERYAVMASTGARSISDYNDLVAAEQKYPFIVVVIDELADIMMTVGKDAEDLIARIAQMARAAGIHLLVATQRPSVDVITGLIKVNFPSRISFRVTSRIDSRTILDVGGAEKLLGKGDMLFLDAASSSIRRVHGAFVSDAQIATVVEHIKAQGEPQYVEFNQVVSSEDSGIDEQLMADVIAFINTVDEISISLLQRVFRIGYNRSARIVQELETRGLLLPQGSGKMRRVVKE